MTEVHVTADTNILASGAVVTRRNSAPVRFVSAWQEKAFTLVLSDHILGELDTTLSQPYFARRLPPGRYAEYMSGLRHQAIIVLPAPAIQGVASHPEDDLVLATAVSGKAEYLVTGDHRLLALKQYEEVIIVSVHAFLGLLPGLSPG